MSVFIKNTGSSQINDLMLDLKLLEKQEKAKSKTNRSNKNRAQINNTETKITRKGINKTKKLVLLKDKQDQQTSGKSD
jgi:hypothetical protein